MLAIDDAANEAVYGRDTTPRMIFEGRAVQAPSNAVVDFRDRLVEASAAARAARSDGPAPAPRAAVTASSTATATSTGTSTTSTAAAPAAAQPTPFEPVQDNPATTEPLPATP